jgi:phage terminase large subunit
MLKISRPDISSTEISEYPVEDRFIKLPVQKYVDLLGMKLNGPQIAIVNALNNPKYRFVVAAVSRRVGKTTIANIIGQLVTLVPGSNVLIMSPNYALSSISFEEQRKLINHFKLEVERDNAKDRIIELKNGSTIRMGSVSQVDSVVGRSYSLIIFDEAALTSDGQEAFEIALRPTLDRPDSKAIFISTPRGRNNWFSTYHGYGFNTIPAFSKWASIHADYKENPRVSSSDIEEARATMPASRFAQEYEASFTLYEGKIFMFDDKKSVMPVERWEHTERIMGMDIGFKDATAMLVLGYDYDEQKFYALDEWQGSGKTTEQLAVECKQLETKYDVQMIFIDSAAQQTRYDLAVNYDISTINATKSVLDGIAYVQTIVEQGNLIVDPKCVHLIAALDQFRWNPSDTLLTEKPIHDKYSHMADALRYALYSYRSNVGNF